MNQINHLFAFYCYISFSIRKCMRNFHSAVCLKNKFSGHHPPIANHFLLLFCHKRNGEFCNDISLQIRVELSGIWTRKISSASWDDLIHTATPLMNYRTLAQNVTLNLFREWQVQGFSIHFEDSIFLQHSSKVLEVILRSLL